MKKKFLAYKMCRLSHLRSRVLPLVILGFVVITLYAYYRTSVDDYHSFLEVVHSRHLTVSGKIHENPTVDPSGLSLLPKNVTIEPTALNSNASSHNTQQLLTEPASALSTFMGPQSSSSASISVNLPSINATQQQQIQPISSKVNTVIKFVANDSVRAIYPLGHDVTVAEKCPKYGKDMNLVIVIMSAPSHQDARTAIRQTWGHYGQRADIGIVFIIGKTKDLKIEKKLEEEQKLYDDIIRGRFLDAYSNLTLKTVSTFEWVSTYCSEAKFILKTDDDMFINVPRLLTFIEKHKKDKNVIFGKVARKWKPFRNKKSKYYVSPAQFKGKVFPDFATGPAYLLSRDVIDKLYENSLNQTFMTLEDVFMTGIVAQKLGIKRVYVSEFLNKRIPFNPCNVQRGISIHMVKYSEQFDLWKKLLDGKSKCK